MNRNPEELKFFFDLSVDLLCVAGFDGYFQMLNPAWEKTLGFSTEELLAKPYIEFVHPDDRKRTLAEAAKAAASKPSKNFENRYQCKDGSYCHLTWKMTPVPDRKCFYAIARDITEVKATEIRQRDIDAKLESQRVLQSLVEASPQAIIVLDLDQHVRQWNPAAAEMFGWKAEDVIGKPVPNVPADQQQEHAALIEKALQGEPVKNLEVQRQRHDGSVANVLLSVVRLHDSGTAISGILIVAADITERKKLEKQFFRAQRMESIGLLAGGIAHDLNNILAPILMAIQLFKDKFVDDASQATLATLESSTRRGANLVKQVLTFARGLEGERMRVQARHVLRDVEKIARQIFPKAIRIEADLPKTLFSVYADPTQLHQVVMNLCVNARDAMPDGGTLYISGRNITVDEHYARMQSGAKPGRYVFFEVRDTGIGIPPEIIETIFEPFFTTKPATMGTGLGLSTVMAIVKNHGGFVNVYSEVGKGTTFKVYLPALAPAQVERIDVTGRNLPSGKGEMILIVDDEVAVRDIARLTLENYGYRVLVAANGAEGIAVFARHVDEIKVILSDMNMPVMDGAAMTKAVRAINPEVRILSSSGLAPNDDEAKRAEEAGISGFISKPYTAEQLLVKLDEMLQQ
jgi:two-component system cell cycle sensor histidine kinase/response regulator CckA